MPQHTLAERKSAFLAEASAGLPLIDAPPTSRPSVSEIMSLQRFGVLEAIPTRVKQAAKVASVPLKIGVDLLFKTIRAPQQALAIGPALAGVRAMREGRGMTIGDVFSGSAEAVRDDLSFRDVLAEGGIDGGVGTASGLILDLVLDPLFLVTPAKLGRLAKLPELLRSNPIQAAVQSRPAQAFGRTFITDFGKPEEFIELSERLQREVSRAVERAVDIGKRIHVLPDAEQRAVRKYMEAGEHTARQRVLLEADVMGLDADAIGTLAHEAMVRDVGLGREMADVGLLSPEVVAKWEGKHIRREYRKYVDPQKYVEFLAKRDPTAAAKMEQRLKAASGWSDVGVMPMREQLGFLKKRKDIPQDIREELGEIMEAAHPVASGQAMAGHAVAMRRFLRDTNTQFASDTMQPGFAFVGDGASLGPLKGKFLPEAIASEIQETLRRPGEWEGRWKTGVGWWKYGKVVLNPSTHARNMISNLILADMAGLAPWKVHRYRQALHSLTTKDRWYLEAKEAGTFLLDTYAGVELPNLLKRNLGDVASLRSGIQSASRQLQSKATAALRLPARLYQSEEELFKMAFYIDRRKAGVVPKKAAKEAERALFNYRRVPKFIDSLRRNGAVPFITFPYKALPATARALWNRPFAVSRYGNIFRVFEGPGSDAEKQVLAPYMQDGWMRLRGADSDGRVRYLNMSYILPFGDYGELATGGGMFGHGGAAPSFLNSPLVSLVSMMAVDRDPFRPWQEISKLPGGRIGWLTNFFAPPLFGGYAYRDLKAAIQQRPTNILSLTGETRTLSQAIAANFFGIRIRPVDLQRQRAFRIRDLSREIEDIKVEIRRWQRAHITDEEKNEQLAGQMARIKELMVQAGAIAALHLPDVDIRP